jgi:hypothetical protein
MWSGFSTVIKKFFTRKIQTMKKAKLVVIVLAVVMLMSITVYAFAFTAPQNDSLGDVSTTSDSCTMDKDACANMEDCPDEDEVNVASENGEIGVQVLQCPGICRRFIPTGSTDCASCDVMLCRPAYTNFCLPS